MKLRTVVRGYQPTKTGGAGGRIPGPAGAGRSWPQGGHRGSTHPVPLTATIGTMHCISPSPQPPPVLPACQPALLPSVSVPPPWLPTCRLSV